MAEGREEFLNIFSAAFRTADVLIAKNQGFKPLTALQTLIFKNGHFSFPNIFFNSAALNIRSFKTFFESV